MMTAKDVDCKACSHCFGVHSNIVVAKRAVGNHNSKAVQRCTGSGADFAQVAVN